MRTTTNVLIPRLFTVFCVLGLTVNVALCAEIVVEQDITYGKVGDTELKLDLARPQGDGPFPAIVFIHGGGWSGGSRQGYQGEIQEAAKRGYVAATISYRLMKYDEAKKETTTATPIFPAQIHDAKAAIRWLRANAKKCNVDPNRIGVTGASAGGHLSLLVGLTDPASGLEGDSGNPDQSSRVQAVVNVFGPTDMVYCYEKSSVAWIFRLFMGGTPAEASERYKAASPITYVSKDDPPVLTLHGDQDELVPVEQAQVLDEKMKAAGASHTLMVFKGQGHGFGGEYGKKAADATWEFFDRHLKSVGASGNEVGWISLFNGRNLDGWVVKCLAKDEDKRGCWKIVDGTITAETPPESTHNYIWLLSEEEYSDFELRLKVQTYGTTTGNSGIQVRSRYDDEAGWLDGPQVDLNPPGPWRNGFIYDETRGVQVWLWPDVGPPANAKPEHAPKGWTWKHADKEDVWNEVHIVCRGTKITTIINGVTVADYEGKGRLDDEAHRARNVGMTGHIGLQIHPGDKLLIRFKDIQVRELD